jgi:hypothetical protein
MQRKFASLRYNQSIQLSFPRNYDYILNNLNLRTLISGTNISVFDFFLAFQDKISCTVMDTVGFNVPTS